MKNILDPTDTWLGQPPLLLAETNKRPVTVDDELTLLVDSSSVNVDVLANDFDPEGGSLSLVSAVAALGTAVIEADDTVTYTPPPGISGFDTVVYTVADDLGQTQDGQINVTINEPQLSIETLADSTLAVVAETGPMTLDITAPAEFAGSYVIDTGDLQSGPINLVAPDYSGPQTEGSVLTAEPGLWIFNPVAGVPVQSWQWLRNGAEIPGATSATYTVGSNDLGQTLVLRETQMDSFGQRFATSDGSSGGSNSNFDPGLDSGVIAWFDASDAATINASGNAVASWSDKASAAALAQNTASRQPTTGLRSQNGLNVLDFDGGDYLETPIFLPTSGDVAIHMAMIIDDVSSAFGAILALEATNDMQIDALSDTQFDGRLNVSGIGSSFNLSGGPFSGSVIVSVLFDRTGSGTAEVFISDTTRGSAAYTTALDPAPALHLMTNRSRNASFDGAVCELVVTETLGNRSDHHAYLASKWGIS